MSSYSEYVKERLNHDCYETEDGFITWSIQEDHLFIEEMFVKPKMRLCGIGTHFVDHVIEVAKVQGKKAVGSSIWIKANGASVILIAALKEGFSVFRAESDRLIMKKEF